MPIPHRKLPPEDAVTFYTSPKNRGYLADPEKIADERYALAQKYGYKFIDISTDPMVRYICIYVHINVNLKEKKLNKISLYF